MAELTAIFLGGLAFFFLGVDGIRSNLKQLASRRFRQVMSHMTGRAYLAGAWGLLFGAVTQSATAVSFIVVGMIASGLLTLQRALLIVAMANLGTVALVFLAAIDISVAIYYLIGITGLLITFQVVQRLEVSLRVLLSVGLLLLGLHLMKQATGPLPKYHWFAALITVVHGSVFTGFLLGVFLRAIIQSSSAIVILGIAFAQAGLLTNQQVLLVMHGTAVGVGGSTLLFASNLRGIPRQIAIFQGLINTFAGLLLVIAFYAGSLTDLPLLNHLVTLSNPADLDVRLAIAFLIQQTIVAASGLLLLPRSERLLTRLSPPSEEHDLAKLRYLPDASVDDPETAVVLMQKEQQRLVEYLALYLAPVREEQSLVPIVNADALLAATRQIDSESRDLASELAAGLLDPDISRRLLQVQQQERLILTLHENLHEFAKIAGLARQTSRDSRLRHNLVEALDTIVLTAIDACRSEEDFDLQLLLSMTADRGELMEQLHTTHLGEVSNGNLKDQADLMYLMTLFERLIWMLNQLGRSLRSSVQ
jgi:phosphate:Na+ symporter